MEAGIEAHGRHITAVSRWVPLGVQRNPAVVAVHVVERQADVRALRAAGGDDGPEGEEAKGEFGCEWQECGWQVVLFGEIGDGQEKEWLVWRRAAGAVDVQVRGGLEPVGVSGRARHMVKRIPRPGMGCEREVRA